MNAGEVITAFGADISNFISGLNRMSSQGSAWAASVNSFASSAASGFSGFLSRIGSAVNLFGTHLDENGNKVGNWGRSILSGIQSFGQFTMFARSGISTILDVGQALLGSSADMEMTRQAYIGLMGGAKQADAMMRQLQQFAASTPLEFPQVAKDTQMLIGMGFAARDAIPVMTAIGDAAFGVGAGAEGAHQVTLALGQMQAAGKIGGQDMMQLTEAGIPAWKILASSMHLSVGEVMQLSQQGKLGGDAITSLWHGMEKMYGGQMSGQANTFNGLLSTLHDNANMALMAFVGPAFTMAKAGLGQLTTLVGSPAFAQFAGVLGTQVGQALSKVVVVIPQIVGWFAQFGPAVSGVWSSLVQLYSVVAPLVAGFIQWGVSSGAFRGALDGVGMAISGILAVIGGLISGLSNVISFFVQGGPAAQVLEAAIAGIAAAFLVLKAVQIAGSIATFISLIPTMVGLMGLWAASTWAVVVPWVILNWPILAIGLAVALVVAGVILAIRNWGAISTWLVGVWTNIRTFFVGLWANIVSIFQAAVSGISTFFVGIWTSIISFFKSAGTAIGALSTSIWTGIQNGIKVAWDFIVNVVKIGVMLLYYAIFGPFLLVGALFQWLYAHNTYVKALCDAIVNFFRAAIAWVQSAWTNAVQWVVNAWSILRTAATVVWSAITTVIRSVVQAVVSWLQGIWSTITGWLQGQWQILRFAAAMVWNAISAVISSAVSTASGIVHSIFSSVVGFLSGIWNTIRSGAQQAWSFVTSVFSSAWGGISGALSSLWSNISSWFSNLASQALTWGASIIQGFIDGITSMLGNVANAASNVASTVASFLGFHSPTEKGPGQYLDSWGPALTSGFAAGIYRGIPQVQAAVDLMMQPVGASMSTNVSASSTAAGSGSGRGRPIIIKFIVNGREFVQAIGTDLADEIMLQLGGTH
jgi:tape measure domain-containing protein